MRSTRWGFSARPRSPPTYSPRGVPVSITKRSQFTLPNQGRRPSHGSPCSSIFQGMYSKYRNQRWSVAAPGLERKLLSVRSACVAFVGATPGNRNCGNWVRQPPLPWDRSCIRTFALGRPNGQGWQRYFLVRAAMAGCPLETHAICQARRLQRLRWWAARSAASLPTPSMESRF